MGRRRSVRPETPLRRSSRLRGIHQALEETEDVTFEFVESQTISDDEDGEKVTTEKKESAEELRKTVRPATSRIPTFQSSVGRKRPTGNNTESSFSAKMETSIPQAQTRERDSVGGETSRVKIPVYNSKDTAIPVPAVRMPFVSADEQSRVDLSQVDLGVTSVHLKRNSSPDLDAGDSGTSLHRPALRADLGSYDAEVESQFISGDSSPVVVQENLDTDPGGEVMTDSSSTTSPSDGQAPALTLKLESSNTGQGTDEERMYETEALELSKNVTVSLTHKMETDSTTEDEGSQDESTDEKMEEEIAGEVCNEGPIQTESDSERDKSAVPESKQDTLTNWKTDAEETEPEMKPKASVKPVSQSSGSHCPSAKTKGSSFMWFCLVPSLLLVLGGFGQHVWLYGVPQSVSHLMAQLELHWLEGFLPPPEACSSDCSLTLVESIPEGLQFPPGSPQLPSISQSWGRLLNRANRSVTIAAFYLTLRDLDLSGAKPSAAQGEKVFRQLMELESRGVKLQVAVNAPQTSSADTDELVATGAEVRAVDLQGVTGGIVHTKLWVVDNTHMYVGSANMDWRSLSQVKEVGVTVEDCSCLAQDASRIFGVYWDIGAQKNGSLPPYWPGRFSALSSSKHPLVVKFNGVPARAYLSSSPPLLSAYGRSDDLSTILSVIADAKQFIYVSVMDYLPFSQYIKPLRFWPVIDTALREAACVRGVEVRLLLSCWAHSPGAMFVFAQSLAVLSRPPLGCSVSVKVFEVPSTPEQLHIPYARVNHAKYMVTDRVVYIGTSNWSENYFTQTAGVGLVVNQTGLEVGKDQQTVQSQLQGVFQRDWASGFAQTLTDQHTECVQRRRPVA